MQENRIFDKNMSIMIKGVAIILMLFHHFFGFPDWIIEGNMFIGLGDNYNCVERKIGLFGAICVELFVFITGYGSYYIKLCSAPENTGTILPQMQWRTDAPPAPEPHGSR